MCFTSYTQHIALYNATVLILRIFLSRQYSKIEKELLRIEERNKIYERKLNIFHCNKINLFENNYSKTELAHLKGTDVSLLCELTQ